jgi:hypothetical protein
VARLTKRNSKPAEKRDIRVMKKSSTLSLAAPLFLCAPFAFAQNVVANAPEGAGATTIYRQVLPDGRVVYSDTVTKGVKIDRILLVPGPQPNQVASKPLPGEQSRSAGNTGAPAGSGNTGR